MVLTGDTIYNEDCMDTMSKMSDNSIDTIITSPPYNMTDRKGGESDTGRYDVYVDWKTIDEYIQFTIDIFNQFDRVLKKDGMIAYNFSYSIENPSLPYRLVSEIERNTEFALVDTIIWKKKSGLPFPANQRRLSRIWEYVFIFVRKNEMDTFSTNRVVSSVSKDTDQTYYEVIYNYLECRNNDGVCPYNQATYSTELVESLLKIYSRPNDTIYDPFMGSGTTAVACMRLNRHYIGSEISENQCKWAEDRLKKWKSQTRLEVD